jgi:hypothetical protein
MRNYRPDANRLLSESKQLPEDDARREIQTALEQAFYDGQQSKEQD